MEGDGAPHQGVMSNDDRHARTIFARNIAYSAQEQDFLDIPAFASAVNIKLPVDAGTGNLRGFGFIEFATAEECAKALAEIPEGSFELHGRQCYIGQSNPNGGGGGRGRGRGGFNQGGGYRGRGGFRGGFNNNRGGYNNSGGFGNQGYGGQQQGYGGRGGYGGQQQGGGYQQRGGYGGPPAQQHHSQDFSGDHGFGGQY